MLSALDGRINRKTYIIGNLVAVGVLLAFCAIIVIPLAILQIAISNKTFDSVLGLLYFAAAFPAVLYYFYFCVLMVKRAHDIGYPGLMLAFGFTAAMGIGHFFDFYLLNILAILLIGLLCAMPGKKVRNNFGPPPRKNFKADNLKVTF